MPTTPQDEREVCVRELDAYLLKLRRASTQHSQFLRGVEAARALLAKEADEPWHGTPNGYNQHKCRRKCCRDAMTAYRQRLRGERRPASKPPRFDGKARCSECFCWMDSADAMHKNVSGRRRAFCGEACQITFIIKREAA